MMSILLHLPKNPNTHPAYPSADPAYSIVGDQGAILLIQHTSPEVIVINHNLACPLDLCQFCNSKCTDHKTRPVILNILLRIDKQTGKD